MWLIILNTGSLKSRDLVKPFLLCYPMLEGRKGEREREGEGEHGELIISGAQLFDNDSNLFIAFHPLTVISLAIIKMEITFSTHKF